MGHELVPFIGEMGQPAAPALTDKKERKGKYWISPMDPGYVSDKPGKAPCGMDMVPVYEEEAGTAKEGTIGGPQHPPVHGGEDRQGRGQGL